MKTQLRQTLTAFFALFSITACQDYTPFWGDEGGGASGSGDPSKYFSFNTTKEFTINIDYGKKGSRALIDVFTEDPTYLGTDGKVYINNDAEFKVFLDNNGQYKGKVVLPADTKKVWVYTMRMGVPQMLLANVDGDKIDADGTGKLGDDDKNNPGYTQGRESDFKVLATTYDGENDTKPLTIWQPPYRDNRSDRGGPGDEKEERMFSIVNWAGQRYGRIIPTHYYDTGGKRHNVINTKGTYNTQGLITNYADVINEEGVDTIIGTKDIEVIQHFLWNTSETKQQDLDNRKYYENLETEDVNTIIPYKYISNGQAIDVDSAQVWLRFLGEGAYYCDGIGYYYYKTGEAPKEPKDIKRYFVAIPNTSSTAEYAGEDVFLGRTVPFITGKFGWRIKDDKGDWDYHEGEDDKKDTYTMTEDGTWIWNTMTKQWTWTFHPKYVPFDINQRIQLLYYEEGENGKGRVTKYFPPGITIGFFLFHSPAEGEGYLESYNSTPTYAVDNRFVFQHSDMLLNEENEYKDSKNQVIGKSRRHYIALNYKNFVVYGVEDGVDSSMEDVLFTVETDPIGLVVNDDRYTIDDTFNATTTNHRTYCFEDIWPDGGDYDMNDVVIDHHHRMTFYRNGDGDITNDYITTIEDDFTAIQPTNAADYIDAFGIQIPNDRIGKDGIVVKRDGVEMTAVEQSDGKNNISDLEYLIDEEEDKTTIILFTNAKTARYHKYTVTRNVTGMQLHIDNTKLEQEDTNGNMINVLNPFIISQYDIKSGEGRHEIHLPKHPRTSKGVDAKGEGVEGADYYVGQYKDGLHPFAVSLPKSAFNYHWGQHYVSEDGEGRGIGLAYPYFDKWATTNGKEYPDWYRYPEGAGRHPADQGDETDNKTEN